MTATAQACILQQYRLVLYSLMNGVKEVVVALNAVLAHNREEKGGSS